MGGDGDISSGSVDSRGIVQEHIVRTRRQSHVDG